MIVFSGDGTIFRVSASGGTPEAFIAPDTSRKETQVGLPQFLPDGDHFLFTVASDRSEAAGLWVISLASRDRKRLLPFPVRAKYSPTTGDLLYLRDGRLVQQPFDLARLELAGEATLFDLDSADKGIGAFDISSDGILVWNATPNRAARLVWRDRKGDKTNVALAPGLYRQIRLSPDATQAAVNVVSEDQGQGQTIWLLEMATGVFSQLGSGLRQANDVVWSPDGRQIAFAWRGNLYRNLIGSQEIIPVIESPVSTWLHDWSPDGRSLVFARDQGVYIMSPQAGSPISTLLENKFNKDEFRVSPDSRWIAYNSDESGRYEIYVASFPKFENRRQISNSGGAIPRWRGDMREMYYMRLDGTLMTVEVRNGEVLQTGSPQPLFQTDVPVSSVLDQYDVTADGQRFLIIENEEGAASPPIHVAVNWLKRQNANGNQKGQ